MNGRLAKFALHFLQWFCPEYLLEEIEGDLVQKYERDVKTFGERKARRRFVRNVVRFFRPGIVLRNRFSFELNQTYMLRNYFKIAYRNLVKHKSFSLINALGLAVGITAFFLIVQYVSFERSYDKIFLNGESIYRVALLRHLNGDQQQASAKTFVGVQSILKKNFPEVESFTGFYKTPANTGFLFRYNGKIYNEPGGVLNPDSSFFRVFPSLLLRGDPGSVLSQKQNLVISESMAKKIFGDEDPIGQTIERIDDYDKGSDFMITGVLKDVPENVHFHASFIRHIDDSWPDRDDWNEGFLYTYISIAKDGDPKKIENRLNALLSDVENEYPDVKGSTALLQPLTDIHLISHFIDELEPNGDRDLLTILSLIGFVVLAMAWINYINLQTTRVISRSKEVAIKRVIGSGKSDLMLQFLIEYLCISVSAILIAAILLYFIYPYYSRITGVPLQVREFVTPIVWSLALAIFVFGSFIVGIYPGLFLLKLNPVKALGGRTNGPGQGSMVRRVFVVFQFTASLVLIAFVLVISWQLDFMRMTNKGIDVDHVIALRNPTAYSNQELESKHNEYEAFEHQLSDNTAFKGGRRAWRSPAT